MTFQITSRTKRVVASLLLVGVVGAGASGAVGSATGGSQPAAPATQTPQQH
jgi:hypothetical protein